MIPIDLITGFLGSGKTTFIRKYVEHLLEEDGHPCVLENDYGAINVDTLLLRETFGDRCGVEMVVGGGDPDCHRRRFRTKLIELAMLGYDRVIVEPSGVFDTDEFFDLLYEDPFDRWYEAGSVLSIVDAELPDVLSDASEYLLASEAAGAGLILPSKVQLCKTNPVNGLLRHLNRALAGAGCRRVLTEKDVLAKDWEGLTPEDWKRLTTCGYVRADHVKLPVDRDGSYSNLFYFKLSMTPEKLIGITKQLFASPDKYGDVIRVKGFLKKAVDQGKTGDLKKTEDPEKTVDPKKTDDPKEKDEQKEGKGEQVWYEINASRDSIDFHETKIGQEVVILVGEHLNSEAIGALFGETRSVTDYSI